MNYNKSNVSTSSKNNRTTCKNCNQPINRGAPICYHCGELQESYNLSPEAQSRLQKKIRELIREYNSIEIDLSELFDKSAERYAKASARLDYLMNTDIMKGTLNEDKLNRLKKVYSLCVSNEYSIAFIGNIKAGKSSLINELLGCDLASVDTTPETATLTKFRSSNDGFKLLLNFYTTNEWNDIWNAANNVGNSNSLFTSKYMELNADSIKKNCINSKPKSFTLKTIEELKEQLTKWTSSQYPGHFFVKEVEVQVNKELLDIPSDVVLVDTPGLDDVIPYRSNITRKYLKNANAVVICIKGEAYGSTQNGLIAKVFSNAKKDNVFVLCTQIDRFNNPQEDFKKHRTLWITYLKENAMFGSEDIAAKRLFGVSSRISLLFRQYDNKERKGVFRELEMLATKFNTLSEEQSDMDRKELEPFFSKDGSIRKKLLDISGVNLLWETLYNEIIKQYLKQFNLELIDSWEKCSKILNEVLGSVKNSSDEIINLNNSELKNKELLKEKLVKQKENLEKELQENNWDELHYKLKEQFTSVENEMKDKFNNK